MFLRRKSFWMLIVGSFSLSTYFGSQALAFNQPPVNLSLTTFVDGGAPAGFYYIDFLLLTEGRKARDNNGNAILPGAHVNVFVDLNQFYWITPVKFLGASLAFDVLLPVVAPTARGIPTNTAGLGDLVVGPALHWDHATIFGRPVFQRLEIDATFPTGKYDKGMAINPGTNILTIEPYYSVVWMFHPKWETSWRVFYAMNGENGDTKVKPGQLLHGNYAFSYQVAPKLRLGVQGFILQQMTEDEVNGIKLNGSKERAMGVGPGLVYFGNGLTFMLSRTSEFNVRNRFQGSRTTLELVYRF